MPGIECQTSDDGKAEHAAVQNDREPVDDVPSSQDMNDATDFEADVPSGSKSDPAPEGSNATLSFTVYK